MRLTHNGFSRILLLITILIASFCLTTTAEAIQLGITTAPSAATPTGCSGSAIYSQYSTAPGRTYTVPAGGGQIASWSTLTVNDTPGTTKRFIVVNPGAAPFDYSARSVDTETLPTPLPTNGLATFQLAHPLDVQAGDILAIISDTITNSCMFTGGSLTASDIVTGSTFAAPLTAGTTIMPAINAPNYVLNMSAELVQNMNVGVTGVATPTAIKTGGSSVFNYTVSNTGDSVQPITFHQVVPNNLSILAASTSGDNCGISGQTIDCTVNNVAIGGSANVQVIVTATAAGTYSNTGTVATAFTDPTPANNTATATLTATDPVVPVITPPACKTISLKGQKLSFAKKAIVALNCKVGKVTKKTSKKIKKGYVISTNPGSGKTLANKAAVKITVSKGKPKKKH